jgi:hypothetical protein
MLPISLDFPFVIAPSVFSNVYKFAYLIREKPILTELRDILM